MWYSYIPDLYCLKSEYKTKQSKWRPICNVIDGEWKLWYYQIAIQPLSHFEPQGKWLLHKIKLHGCRIKVLKILDCQYYQLTFPLSALRWVIIIKLTMNEGNIFQTNTVSKPSASEGTTLVPIHLSTSSLKVSDNHINWQYTWHCQRLYSRQVLCQSK